MRGRAPRTIVRDDEAGTVAGRHSEVADIQRVFDALKPVTIGGTGGTRDLNDPARDAREFLTMLGGFYGPVLEEPLCSTLPEVFDGLESLEAEPGEVLYNADGAVPV